MNSNTERDEEMCLSPGTVMALIDEELDREKREAALAHLDGCGRCRELSEELKEAAGVVAAAAQCLDDERIAAWVDYEAGRMRGALGEADVGHIREHLSGCDRCRSQVTMLAEACRRSEGIWERVRAWAAGAVESCRPQAIQTVRWAAVAAVGVVVVGALYLLTVRPKQLTYRPDALVRAEGGGGDRAPRPAEEAVVAQRGGIETPATEGAAGAPAERPRQERVPPVVVARREPREEEPTTTGPSAAFMPEKGSAEGELSAALAELEEARRSGEAAAQARAAFRAAGILHRAKRYREAAAYYREASGAAARADEVELRIDALVLLGAMLAEMGETEQARQELTAASELAEEAGYERGERNARVQIQLLPKAEADDGQ